MEKLMGQEDNWNFPQETVQVINCHAGGEVGDVIVGGVEPPPGETLWEQRNFIARDGRLRNFMLLEPRGGVFRHVNLLVPPKDKQADAAFIIMEPEDTPPMSGSNSICVATVLLERGIVPMHEPQTNLVLEAPGGLVQVCATCKDGKVEQVRVRNLPSFADKLSVPLELAKHPTLHVDTAYGGDSFVAVNAQTLGISGTPDEARDMAELGIKIVRAANEQLGFSHPENAEWQHISFCLFASPAKVCTGGFETESRVVVRPGKIDRSPTGTAVSARMAILHAQGKMKVGQSLTAHSIINSKFIGKIISETTVGTKSAIIPEISGQAHITGTTHHTLDPNDPHPLGYKLSDTWPSC